MARPVRHVLTAVVVGVLATLLSGPPAAASPREARPAQVVKRAVVFEVSNVNTTSVACVSDGETYQLRGRLVGPRREVLGADADRINVLVHDTATGGWFWNLRSHPRYDYATQLARRGETTLVLDRLGYDRSPLADGDATCLGAQADMLHQVVQHLRAGKYAFADSDARAPSAQRVVVHGHSLGASIAQVEAATYDDVDALVVMSWADNGPSEFAVDAATRQSAACLRGQDYAAFAPSAKAFRRGLFVTAPRAVQSAAAPRRNLDPCGDVQSYANNQASSGTAAGEVEAPVLVLFGGRDRLTSDGSPQRQAESYRSSSSVTLHVTRGAGNALPLEKSAPRTQRRVANWLTATLG